MIDLDIIILNQDQLHYVLENYIFIQNLKVVFENLKGSGGFWRGRVEGKNR